MSAHVPAPKQRFEHQQQAASRKKELAARLLQGSAKKPAQVSSSQEAHEAAPVGDGEETVDTPRYVLPQGITFRRAEDEDPVRFGSAYARLAARLLATSRSRSQEFILLWPGTLRSLGMAHAIATMAQWNEGNKRGVRTLLYPAKATFLHSLNHLFVDRTDLGSLAVRLYEPPREPNPLVKVSLPEKDAFLTSLNSIKEIDGRSLHPTVAELLPHFFADVSFQSWRACDGDLLRHVKSRLGHRSHVQALNALSIKSLADPSKAPDAIFALGWRTSSEEALQALRALKRHGGPDVILIDATRQMRKGNPGWKSSIVNFLDALDETWPANTPGICVVSDEPHIRSQILQAISGRKGAKGKTSARMLQPGGFPTVGIPCTGGHEGVLYGQEQENSNPPLANIKVSFTDTKASEFIGLFDRLKNSLQREDWRKPVADSATFLLRLASMPSSTRTLMHWLEQAAVPMAVREAYTWPSYRAKLARLRDDPEFPEKERLQRLVARADELWMAYENGTPFARQLADYIEEHTRGTEKCCVVFTKPTARVLAHRYFETYDGYPEGAGFEVLEDSVRFITSNTLATELGSRGRETVVFAGLDEESLRLLISDPRIGNQAYVLLTRRNAAYLKATLKAVMATNDFQDLSPRIEAMLGQLPEFQGMDEKSLLNREDFVLPTFSFEQALSADVSETEEGDPDAWELVLETGRSIRRSPSAHVYVYDPLLSHTQTRGYRRVDVSELSEGQRLFVMSGELRELTEQALKEAGVPIANDKKFEVTLRSYHRRILDAARSSELGMQLSEKARRLRQRMLDMPDCPKNLPEESSVRTWLDVEKQLGFEFEKSKPQAPRLEAHFRVFARALGLSDVEAIYFWKAVILPLRGVRRADGRRVGDVYSDMLLEPESMVVHQRMKPSVVNTLFSRAKENIYSIEAIKRPMLGESDD